jgi:hypothetical protein
MFAKLILPGGFFQKLFLGTVFSKEKPAFSTNRQKLVNPAHNTSTFELHDLCDPVPLLVDVLSKVFKLEC